MQSRRPRVLLIHSIPTPYRVPLFHCLSEQSDFELTVMFMSASASNRVWSPASSGLPRSKVLRGWTINLRSGDDLFPIWVNPSVPVEIFRGRFDVVICAGWDSLTTFLARAACMAKRIPFVLWAGSTPAETSWRRSVMSMPVQLLVRSADACIAYGTAAKRYLESMGGTRVFVSYNTVDVRTFDTTTRGLQARRDALKHELGIATRHVVIYVGQLIERKGVLTLARAFNRLTPSLDATMLWVGYGALRDQLEQLGKTNPGLHYKFASARTVDELCRLYALADVSVLPSTEEVWGLVVNESLASGVPVITTSAVGAAPDLIKEGCNGFVIAPGDEYALADRITRVIGDDAHLEQWSLNARESMRDYTYDQNVAAFRAAIYAALQ